MEKGQAKGKGQARRKDNVKRNDQVKVKTKGQRREPSQGGGDDWGTKGSIHEKYPPLMIRSREQEARKDVSPACSMQSKSMKRHSGSSGHTSWVYELFEGAGIR